MSYPCNLKRNADLNHVDLTQKEIIRLLKCLNTIILSNIFDKVSMTRVEDGDRPKQG